jgi:hypothetical protein
MTAPMGQRLYFATTWLPLPEVDHLFGRILGVTTTTVLIK